MTNQMNLKRVNMVKSINYKISRIGAQNIKKTLTRVNTMKSIDVYPETLSHVPSPIPKLDSTTQDLVQVWSLQAK